MENGGFRLIFCGKRGSFGRCFPKISKKCAKMRKKEISCVFYGRYRCFFQKIQQKARKNRQKGVREPQFIHISTRVFNSLWKTDWKTFRNKNRKNMVIQNMGKTSVEIRNSGLENPEKGQKNSCCAVRRIFSGVFPQKSTAVHSRKNGDFPAGIPVNPA